MKFVVSGSTGFIGAGLVEYLTKSRYDVRRLQNEAEPEGCDALIHLAGLAHRKAPPSEFFEANHTATVRLAQRAQRAGVSRFIFVSTINVVAGHRTVLSPELDYKPLTPYGDSKAEAERELLKMNGLNVVILRPPLVFGPNVKGSLRVLMKLCASGLPLPFGAIHNRRSMIGLTNLCGALDFLGTANESKVVRRIFHIAEGEAFSLAQIIRTCREAMGISPRLVPVAPSGLRLATQLIGQGKIAEQLLGDLVVDDSSLTAAGWIRKDTAKSDMVNMALSS